MTRRFLAAKLHRATVTAVLPDYEGSIAIDADLLEAAGIAVHEQVAVYDIANGARFETYAIAGERGGRAVTVNGAAARLVMAGDRIIIAAFCDLAPHEIAGHRPRVVLLGEGNRPAGPAPAG